MLRTKAPALMALTIAAACGSAAAEFKAVEHPFILWTKADLAALRRRVRTNPHAIKALEKLRADLAARGSRSRPAQELMLFAATGDAKLGEAQKKELMRVVRSPIPRGGAQWMTVLRYDLLHDRLSKAERAAFEEMARVYIRNAIFDNAVFNPKIFNDSRNYSRYDARKYTRTNWLPNIIWPRKVSANLFAAALRDEGLIRKTWAHYGSWKWYFDEYLCDSGFYSEEFSKMGSTPGAMLLYCLAVERLGLSALGFGHEGKGGATMRGHIRSLIHLGYPRVEVGGDRPHYPMVTMGDLRQVGSSQAGNLPSPAFQHALVMGYLPPGAGSDEAGATGGSLRWRAHGAWGGQIRGRNPQWDGYGGFTPKMQIPLWFELAAKRWPEDGYAYFLAQMRPPGERLYIPSLWFGLDAIDPAKVKPPPAPSAVWPQRGIVMLRADESPAYWQSPAPAVAMRTATNYAHNVRDAFALLGFYAFNRPIYLNRQVWPGYATGWSRSIQSHCGVAVDGKEPKFTDNTTVRHAFARDVKFVAATSGEVFDGVDLTRCLMLTREYLLDITRLAAQEEHDYCWLVHALGRLRPGEKPVPGSPDKVWADGKLPEKLMPLKHLRALHPHNQPWQATIDQVCTLADPSRAKLPKSWYDRKIGVRVHVTAVPDTWAYAADTPKPLLRKRDGPKRVTAEMPSEVGGVTVIAARRAKSTAFTAVHEPFEAGRPRIRRIRQQGASSGGTGVVVYGPDYTDHVLVSFRPPPRSYTVRGGGQLVSFRDFVYVRIAPDGVRATARELNALSLDVGDAKPRFVLNGKPTPATFVRGRLTFRKTGK